VSVLHRYGYSQRRFSMLGSNGQRYFFLVQFATPHSTRSDERMMQLHVMMKRLLEKSIEARRRDLHVHIPLVIPITPRMRLMEDNSSFTSLGELHDVDQQRQGKDPDTAIILFRERITAAIDNEKEAAKTRIGATPEMQAEALKQAELRAKQRALAEINVNLSSDMLTRFVHRSMQDSEAVWAFKRAFAQQLSISSLLCYAFTCGERYPHKLMIDETNARVISHTHQGLLELSEEVPFRLTRNITTLLSPFLIDGVFATTMITTAQALYSRYDIIQPYLNLVLRDDLLSWHASKTPVRSEFEQRLIEKQLTDRMHKNVSRVLQRLEEMCPKRNLVDVKGCALPVDRRVHDLIRIAQREEKLSSMNATWMAWV
jgi:transformation/transcription domain-associated protein